MIELMSFVLDNYPPARSWGVERVNAWLSWFTSRRLLLCVRQNDTLVGVTLFRCVNDAGEAKTHYTHKESNPILFVELAIAKTKGTLRKLWSKVLKERFPTVKRIMWERGARNRGLVEFPFTSAERLIYGRQQF